MQGVVSWGWRYQLRFGMKAHVLMVPCLPSLGKNKGDECLQRVHVVMWYRVYITNNCNLNKLSMNRGRGLENSFIRPVKLCSQHFEKVYVLL